LIVNHDRKRAPSDRPLPYNDAQHILESDTITILPTTELFKIIRAVQGSEITKDEARKVISSPGRVTYKAK
jgi:hypothetical protein